MTTLPAEILDLIVDFIDGSPQGWQTLQACMLTSKALFLKARSRLFSTIVLYNSHNASRLKALRELLEVNTSKLRDSDSRPSSYPPLGPSIKTVHVNWDATAFLPGGGPGETDDLIAIFSFLGNPPCVVQKLGMSFSFTHFPELSPHSEVYQALHAVCSTLTLRSLTLRHVNSFPVDMFDIWQLEELDAQLVTFRAPRSGFVSRANLSISPPSKVTTTTSDPRLRKLTWTFGYNPHPEWFQSASQSMSPFSNLRSLTAKFQHAVSQNSESHLDFDTILSLSRLTLESLQIYLPETKDLFITSPHSLQPLTSLRKLTYVAFASSTIGHSRSFFGWAIEPFLQSLMTLQNVPPSLQHIVLYLAVYINSWGPNTGEVGFSDDAQRRRLLDTLASSQFASVTKIDITLHLLGKDTSGTDIPFFTEFPATTLKEYGKRINVETRRGKYKDEVML